MEQIILASLGILSLFALMFLRMPISFSMLIVGFTGIVIIETLDAGNNVLSADIWNQFSNYTYSVIPLFILMGEIIFRTGISEHLFNTAYKWIGHLRGGMASTTILASAGFSSINGSNAATASTMATIALPELDKYKYKRSLSTGSVAAGGTLGIIIPPSTVLIILAVQMQLSIRDLFIASIIPSLILIALLIATVVFICRRNPDYGPPGKERTSVKEKIISLSGVIPIFLLFLFVVGGLYLGLFTPTESGAFGVLGALVLSILMRKLTWKNFVKAIESTLRTSAMVLLLVVSAVVFGRFLAITELPYMIAGWIEQINVPSIIILLMILLIYVIGGSIMDALGFLIISIPIFSPTITALGYDPLWFAVTVCVVTSMGSITPPVGINALIVQGIASDTPVTTVFRGAANFLIAYAIFIGFLILFPEIVLFPV